MTTNASEPGSAPGFGLKPPWVPYALLGCLALFFAFVVVGIVGSALMYLRTSRPPPAAPVVAPPLPPPTVTPPAAPALPGVAMLPLAYDGQLLPGDAVRQDGSRYDPYPLQILAGDRVVVTLESSDFDAYLTIVSPSGEMLSDDDGAGGTNSRLELTAPAEGTWEVWANSLYADATGSYHLTIELSR